MCDPTPLNIKSLLTQAKYMIPIYQRNYAWGEKEVIQLIQDVIDYFKISKDKKYFIGTLIVYKKKANGDSIYEIIDGQQRYTTLLIIMLALSKHQTLNKSELVSWLKSVNLEFECRKISSETLCYFLDSPDAESTKDVLNDDILQVFNLCYAQNRIEALCNENGIDFIQFIKYFIFNVIITRILVPNDTDLNHYFEIMNSRGEQLEKHEILKAKLIAVLDKSDNSENIKNIFVSIWNAVSDMDEYVQYGFDVATREKLFGEEHWDHFQFNKFEDLIVCFNNIIKKDNKSEDESLSSIISKLSISNCYEKDSRKTEEGIQRFKSIINFPNFLLHVLKIQLHEYSSLKILEKLDKDIPLDDKRLLSSFDKILKHLSTNDERIIFVQDFCFNLLKLKYLFDKYIIKTEFGGWSLKKLHKYENSKASYINSFNDQDDATIFDSNRKILMLLAMFHVSVPTFVYKYWLNASLLFLYLRGNNIDINSYSDFLLALAKKFIFKRFLAKKPTDYYELIYEQDTEINVDRTQIEYSKMTYGKIGSNLLFNYLDYLLWSGVVFKCNSIKIPETIERVLSNEKCRKFEFTTRSSVEHYYPQNPMNGQLLLNSNVLNSFGNLCLIDHKKNSKLSNYSPTAKKDHYKNNTIDSLKQYLMMFQYDDKKWGEEEIKSHESEMMEILFMS